MGSTTVGGLAPKLEPSLHETIDVFVSNSDNKLLSMTILWPSHYYTKSFVQRFQNSLRSRPASVIRGRAAGPSTASVNT